MPVLSIVVPAHNSGTRLEGTVDLLRRELGDAGIEVIIVENGSTDDTWEVAQRLAATSGPFPVLACQSDVGLGAAYREGIRRTSGQTLLLTADDLPFGLTDIDAWRRVDATALVVGSKAHRESRVPRSLLRSVMSGGYRVLRWVVLGMTVADCQGTIFAPRDWLAARLPDLREDGYLASTEIVYLAQQQGKPVIEVPVTLAPRHDDGKTRIRLGDIRDMAFGLLRLRARRRELRQSH